VRGLVCWLLCLSLGCAEIADLRDDPTLIEEESPYTGCERDDQCLVGWFCDRDWTACRPPCTTDADCNGGKCVPATSGGEPRDPELELCATMCDPVAATKCGEGAACFLRESSPSPIWDCGGTLGFAFDQPCDDQGGRHCANGLACIADRCQKLCFVSDPLPAKCTHTTSCEPFPESGQFDGKPVGACY
jgi:hypothetical protein